MSAKVERVVAELLGSVDLMTVPELRIPDECQAICRDFDVRMKEVGVAPPPFLMGEESLKSRRNLVKIMYEAWRQEKKDDEDLQGIQDELEMKPDHKEKLSFLESQSSIFTVAPEQIAESFDEIGSVMGIKSRSLFETSDRFYREIHWVDPRHTAQQKTPKEPEKKKKKKTPKEPERKKKKKTPKAPASASAATQEISTLDSLPVEVPEAPSSSSSSASSMEEVVSMIKARIGEIKETQDYKDHERARNKRQRILTYGTISISGVGPEIEAPKEIFEGVKSIFDEFAERHADKLFESLNDEEVRKKWMKNPPKRFNKLEKIKDDPEKLKEKIWTSLLKDLKGTKLIAGGDSDLTEDYIQNLMAQDKGEIKAPPRTFLAETLTRPGPRQRPKPLKSFPLSFVQVDQEYAWFLYRADSGFIQEDLERMHSLRLSFSPQDLEEVDFDKIVVKQRIIRKGLPALRLFQDGENRYLLVHRTAVSPLVNVIHIQAGTLDTTPVIAKFPIDRSGVPFLHKEALVHFKVMEASRERCCPQITAIVPDLNMVTDGALVMDRVVGGMDPWSLVTRRNEPPQEHAEKIRTIILRVAYLLQHLQSKFKFMHNDLKPNNVMYVQDQEMKVYLIDFGSSSIEDKDGRRFFAANTDFEEAGFLRNEFHEGLDLFMLIMGFLQGYWLQTADSARPAWLENFAVIAESHLYDHANWKGWWVQTMGGRNPSLIETESWRIGYDKDLTSSHAKMLDEFTPSKVIEALSPRTESQKTTEQPALPATTDVDTTESPIGQDRETVLTKRSLMIHPEVDVIGVDQGLQPCFAVLDHRQVLSRKGTKRCPKAWQEALSGFDPEEIVRVLNGLIKDGDDTTSSSETLEQSSLGDGQKIHWTPEATSDGPQEFNQDTRLLGHKVPLQTSIRFNMKMAQEMMRTSTSQKEFAARSDFARSEFVRQALGSTVAQTYMDLRSWVRSYSAQSRAKTLDPCLKHYSKKTIGFQQDSRTVVDLSMTLDRFIDHQSVATAASSSEAVSSQRDGRSALRHLMIKQCLPRPTDSKFEARANFFDKLSELRFQVLSIRPSVAAFATKGPPKSRLSLGSKKVKLGALFEDQDVESVDFLRDDGEKDRAHPTPAHGTHFPVEFMDRVVDHTRNMVFLRPSSSDSRFPPRSAPSLWLATPEPRPFGCQSRSSHWRT